jgi:indole-3-glycerol phosphate synthase
MQQQVDVGSIVPSTRDLFQVIATRKRSMALVAQLGEARPAEEAARLHELNVSAFCFAEPGPAMQAAARATKTVPSLCLRPASDREEFLAARLYGADGVCIDDKLTPDAWDKLAKNARTTRMLPLAVAHDAAGVEAAIKAGARVLLVWASSASELCALAATVPRAMTLVGAIRGGEGAAGGEGAGEADATAIRALRGHVDAVIIPPSVHEAANFAELVTELDP